MKFLIITSWISLGAVITFVFVIGLLSFKQNVEQNVEFAWLKTHRERLQKRFGLELDTPYIKRSDQWFSRESLVIFDLDPEGVFAESGFQVDDLIIEPSDQLFFLKLDSLADSDIKIKIARNWKPSQKFEEKELILKSINRNEVSEGEQ